MRVTFCESCGAPIDARWAEIVLVCRYCEAQNAPGGPSEPVPSSTPDDGRPRLAVGGRTYLLEGRVARGDATDVYRGRWVMRLGELVVVKVQRSTADGDLVRREHAVLRRLQESPAQGSARFADRLPQPIALGAIKTDRERLVSVHRWRSGFVWDLDDVGQVHPGGVEPAVATWLFKRLLELLGWVHRAGMVHGAVIPPHVLVHPRDHGAILVGWSTAVAHGERLPAVSRAWRALYPDEATRRPTPATDLAMAARCVLAAAGADSFDAAGTLPGGLGRLVIEAAKGAHTDAWALRERLDAEALTALGPPRYSPLPMPERLTIERGK